MTTEYVSEMSTIHFHPTRSLPPSPAHEMIAGRPSLSQVQALLAQSPDLLQRFQRVTDFGRTIRASEYRIKNACNIGYQRKASLWTRFADKAWAGASLM